MARSRNIKPGFFKNDLLVELPFECRLLFIGIWTMADRAGRLEDRPTKIRMEVFPADSVDVDVCLQALHDKGFISRYTVDGTRYIQIITWDKHQNPHKKEAPSTIPAQCEHGASPVLAPTKAGTSPADSLIPDSLSITEANASGAVAPQEPDPIWHTGLSFLKRKGIPEPSARKFLGKLKREAGDIDAAALLAEAEADDITDPIPWLTRSAVAVRERARQRGSPGAKPISATRNAAETLLTGTSHAKRNLDQRHDPPRLGQTFEPAT